MTRRILNIEAMEKRANEPAFRRVNPRAHRGVRVKIYKSGREKTANVVPTDRDRENFDLIRPDDVRQGYEVRWQENDTRRPGGDE